MGELIGPFRKVPPQSGEELPILQPHEISAIEDAISSSMMVDRIEQ